MSQFGSLNSLDDDVPSLQSDFGDGFKPGNSLKE